MRSTDGVIQYSKILSAFIGLELTPALYPNPVQGEASLQWHKILNNAQVAVFNTSGIKVMEVNIRNSSNATTVNLSRLKKGIYQLVISDKDVAIAKLRFIKN